ncbi:lysosomal proton-coupled steroid conjugate and bile acid symporter SLC46A3 [Leptinotarsa decemlineata]|uniref:lysosomal proton-coupled steroid conjugate and bile acid symporter SLC46A3 n=1 Tax=Leptinotarsa decemlineata TaxID=7539 RepID=UPI000C255B84|nr:uncharacterized protein LOC111502374 [Leptinotarsa decemlineata]
MASTAELVTESVADLTKKDEKRFGQMDFTEKMSYVQEVITVEPLIGAYVMAATLCGPTLYNLEFEKACRVNLEMNDTVCEAILSGQHENFTNQNNQVLIAVSNMHSWQLPVQSFMPLILVLFLGSYSDRHQIRKPFLLIPIFGELFAVVGCILCVVFMRSWSLEVLGVFQVVVPSFFGGQPMIVMAVFAYIADVSTLQMRTLRVGIVQIVLNTILPITQLFSAHYFELVGYYGVLLTAGGLYILGLVYGLFWIKESRIPVKSSRGLLSDVFDPKHAIDTFNLMLKKSPGNNRVYISLILLTLFVYSAVVVGEGGMFFSYTQGRFGWTIVEYSHFIFVNTLIHLFGTALAVPLFTKVLNFSDMTILLITIIDKIVSNFVFLFANTSTLLYAAAVVSIVTGVTPIGIRSLATKVVSESDLGKAQSLFGICEALAPAISTPIYNKVIYNNTLETYPSAFFILGILLFASCSVAILRMYLSEKKKPSLVLSANVKEMNGKGAKEIPIEGYAETTHI